MISSEDAPIQISEISPAVVETRIFGLALSRSVRYARISIRDPLGSRPDIISRMDGILGWRKKGVKIAYFKFDM